MTRCWFSSASGGFKGRYNYSVPTWRSISVGLLSCCEHGGHWGADAPIRGTPVVGASASEAPCFMEAPSPSAGKKRSSTHLTCKQPSRTPHRHCPNPTCMGKHIYRRRCECGKACVWRCPQCEAVVSASNAARHKCRPSMAAVPKAPPLGDARPRAP